MTAISADVATRAAPASTLDDILPPALRTALETRYWRPIEEQARFERFIADPAFHADPHAHVAIYADHGVVHVRDVAARVLDLAESLDGVLLARRTPPRRRFLAGLGVLTTYLHDIGMVAATPEGRRAHPVFAAREPYRRRFDDLAAMLRADDVGGIVTRIAAVHAAEPFAAGPEAVLREVLALAMCHSKTAVPMAVFNDPVALRRLLTAAVLEDHPMDIEHGATAARRRYVDPDAAFAWLVADSPAQRALADDARDAIRMVRAADALRQRGTTLRTSAGYEIFVDGATGQAVYALRNADRDRVFYVRVDGDLAAGEANLRVAELTGATLTIGFHRASFGDTAAASSAARAAATVIADIWADVVPSFEGAGDVVGLPAPAVTADEIDVVLLVPPAADAFVDAVAAELARRAPRCRRRLYRVAEEPPVRPPDLDWSQRGEPVEPTSPLATELLAGLAASGWRTDGIDPDRAFVGARLVTAAPGETVIRAGSAAEHVVVPMAEGLRIDSLGGYDSRVGRPWIPVGVTGVVRDDERNSDIVAEVAVPLVVIPAQVFLQSWFQPYERGDLAALADRLTREGW